MNSQSELLTKFFVAILAFFSVYGDKKNIVKDVTKCSFITASKCDCFAKFLSQLEHITIEALELINEIDRDETETYVVP